MKTYKFWQDFETNAMNEQDLLKFALDLWRDGCLKITSHWDEESQKTITRYSIIARVDE